MATLILSTAGSQLFGPIGGFLGAMAGSRLDAMVNSELAGYKKQPSRLSGPKLQTSIDGAPMPIIYGKMRIAGQVIWAAKFKETMVKRRIGGKTGQKVKELYYSLSFAIGLCEGPINGIGKVWANGEEWDLSQVEHRIYLKTETQEPDSIIEAIEGVENAPHYKGLAYVVFEDLPLAEFGDRIPQLSFEVFANPKNQNGENLEGKIEAVCMIPGANEFAYATTPIRAVITKGKEEVLNQHQNRKVDIIASLDNLARDLPNVSSISLVAAWFGTDLRAQNCQIVPKVDNANKNTIPRPWFAAGLSRSTAQVVSAHQGNPAYGGSPDDASLIEAIIAMKARNIAVALNPFIMMDIPQNNQLPNPWGSGFQGEYPWRGRISCYPAPLQSGTVDGTANAAGQINSFFGTVTASHFSVNGQNLAYSGPNEWSYSRFILHMAAIAKAAGGVDTFLIGSEMIGLTTVRDINGGFPFVDKLVALAGQVRAILGANCKISYSADWTEYGAYYHYPSNNTYFPLDKLWANSEIDFVGIDYYAPLSDRAAFDARLKLEELMNNVEGGEGYEYFYVSETERQNRAPTPIVDAVYNEPWVYRQKDIRNWWQNNHYPRLNGIRQTAKTPWNSGSKPIRFMELGFPAIDKGGNRPSIFPDAKSIENGIPPFSSGKRDDHEQRQCLDAFLTYWNIHNQTASQFQGNMIALDKTHLWAWDARPFPAFPALTSVWRDAENYGKGHWLMGRMGQVSIANILADIANRSGVEVTVRDDLGAIDGYLIDAPMSARDAVEPLLQTFGINLNIESDVLIFSSIQKPVAAFQITKSDLSADEDGALYVRKSDFNSAISKLNFSSYSVENQYEVITHQAQNGVVAGILAQFSAPIIGGHELRNQIASRSLSAMKASQEILEITPSHELGLKLELGDVVGFLEKGLWVVASIEGTMPTKMLLTKPMPEGLNGTNSLAAQHNLPAIFAPTPLAFVLDLPYPFTSVQDPKPSCFATSSPWGGSIEVSLYNEVVATIQKPARAGVMLTGLPATNTSVKLNIPIEIHLDFGNLESTNGYLGLLQSGVIIDIISYQTATLVGADIYKLDGVVRGLNGIATAPTIGPNCPCVLLDDASVSAELGREYWLQGLDWQFGAPNSTNVEVVTSSFEGTAALPWSPCHLRATRDGASIIISFVPRESGNFDNWEMPSPISTNDSYKIAIWHQNQIIRTINHNSTNYDYIDELADFGAAQSNLKLSVAQFAQDGRPGFANTKAIVIN